MLAYEFYGWYRRNYNDLDKLCNTTFLFKQRTCDGTQVPREVTISRVDVELSSKEMDISLVVNMSRDIEMECSVDDIYFDTPANWVKLANECEKHNRELALRAILNYMKVGRVTLEDIKEACEDGRRRSNKKKSNHG